MTPDIALNLMLRGSFFILLMIFTVHGLILAYHWFTYGTTYKTAMTGVFLYLIGGTFCFLLMLPALL